MDVLEKNFPQSFHSKPVTPHLFVGRGRAGDETQDSGDVILCDREYLWDILLGLDSVKESIQYYLMGEHLFSTEDVMKQKEIFQKRFPNIEVTDDAINRMLEDVDDQPAHRKQLEDRLQQLFTRIKEIVPELFRLFSHPELFDDIYLRKAFFRLAIERLKFSVKLIRIQEEWELVQVGFAEADAPHPIIDSETGLRISPWSSWARIIPASTDDPSLSTIINRFHGHTFLHARQAPLQAVLIAERWRKKIEDFVNRIREQSQNPFAVVKQMPTVNSMTKTTMIREGLSAHMKTIGAPAPDTEQTQKIFAFGEQEHTAEMGRFMAHLDKDVTTINRLLVVFMAAFFTPAGFAEMEVPEMEGDWWEGDGFCMPAIPPTSFKRDLFK